MIVYPNIPNKPYGCREFRLLSKKFKKITNNNPHKFLQNTLELIIDNYEEDELLDYAVVESIESIFSVSNNCSVDSEIFRHSFLRELLNCNLYHTVHTLKSHIKSLL